MSVSPQAIQALLAQRLQQAPQGGSAAVPATGQQAQTSPLGAAAAVAQQVLLMRALQQRQQPQPQPGGFGSGDPNSDWSSSVPSTNTGQGAPGTFNNPLQGGATPDLSGAALQGGGLGSAMAQLTPEQLQQYQAMLGGGGG